MPIEKYRTTVVVVALLLVGIFSVVLSTGVLTRTSTTLEPDNATLTRPQVIIRIDDIQDYAFKEGQDFLLNFHAANRIPVDLAVIPGYIGEDQETVRLLKSCILNGSEISVHGWLHENMGLLDEAVQTELLLKSNDKLERILGLKSGILVPPMFSYGNSTIEAMRRTGYHILSSSVHQSIPPSESSDVLLIPATVELSTFQNSTWSMKTPETILLEVEASVSRYGYAVIVLHPQEFIRDNVLSDELAKNYEDLVAALTERYVLTDFEGGADTCEKLLHSDQ